MSLPASSVGGGRGTAGQRARVVLLGAVAALVARLPTGLVGALADSIGELWYRATPGRAAMARANLGRVCANLAATGRGSARGRAAAADPDVLERLVRGTYRHAVRTYAESFRHAAIARELDARLTIENPAAVEAAFDGRAAVFATMHFGSLEAQSAVIEGRAHSLITSPMETVGDPELQGFLARTRGTPKIRLVGLREARREMRAALARGELVGIVADRDVLGGGVAVPLFGSPAPLPVGPALLAVEEDVPIHVAGIRRLQGERFAGHLETIRPAVVAPESGGPGRRRARVEAVLAAEAAAFEHFVGEAPEQWWAVFFPIWPDLGPATRRAR